MGSVVMMYVLPMMLGQTYHLGKDKTGLHIFPDSALEKSTVIQHYFTDSQYKLVENSQDIKDLLDVSGKLALKIKSNTVKVNAEGSYLKDTSLNTNAVEVLVKVHFETVTKTMSSSARPKGDWVFQHEDYLGTHYCRSITYGGDLIASVKISASNDYDMEHIKGTLSGEISSGESFEADLKAKLEKLKSSMQDSASTEIKYYATVPLKGVSYTLDGLMKLVDKFPDHVKEINDGIGNPLRMELYPLNYFKQDYPTYVENRAMLYQLSDLEEQFDDIRATRRELETWLLDLPPTISKTVQSMIEGFRTKLNKIFEIFLQTITDMDLSAGISTNPLKGAFDAYANDGHIIPQKYLRKFKRLQMNVYKEAPETKPKIGGAFYIRWGKGSCNEAATETTTRGVAATSLTNQNGGSSEFICSPLNPLLVHMQDSSFFKGKSYQKSKLLVAPLLYDGKLEKFTAMRMNEVSCASCRVRQRSAVLMKAAATSCPEKWVKEYSGFLMAATSSSERGQYICVDQAMEKPDGSADFDASYKSKYTGIQEVTAKCGSLPCTVYQEKKALPCVVCTL